MLGKRHKRWSAAHIGAWRLLREAERRPPDWMAQHTAAGPSVKLLALAAVLAAPLAFTWWKVLIAAGVIALAAAAVRGRNSVVIETFEDHVVAAGDPAGADGAAADPGTRVHRPDTSGMAPLLATRLTEMRRVYEELEEPLARPHPGRPVEGAVQLQDIGNVLSSAFMTQQTVSVGAVRLPVGALMMLVGRVVQAPRLCGAIYGDERRLTITASLSRNGDDRVWSFDRPVGAGETLAQARAVMVGQLAYRVFTDLSLCGQAVWPATKFWLDALKERQACQRTPRDRRIHLERAEQHLRNALAEDERFYLAAYNLGVVYRQLAEDDAARQDVARTELRGVPDEPFMRSAVRAFAHAIERIDSGRWEAYYGLALAQWKLAERACGDGRRRRARVIELCDRALEIAPGRPARAQILDLTAMAQWRLGRRREALVTWHAACRTVLHELAWAELRRWLRPDDLRVARVRKQASQCLLNLAVAYATEARDVARAGSRPRRWWRYQPIAQLTAFATALSDVDAAAHAKMAAIARQWRRPQIAVAELQRAIRMDPDNPVYWAWLAQVHVDVAQGLPAERRDARARARAEARRACGEAERAIDFAAARVPREQEAVGRLTDAYRRMNATGPLRTLRGRHALGLEIADARAAGDDAAIARLRDLLRRCWRGGRGWEAALVAHQLGRALLRRGGRGDARMAELLFEYAVKRLKDPRRGKPVDIRRWGLQSDVARAIVGQIDRTSEALPRAQEGVAIDPLSSNAWQALAAVRAHGRDFEGACSAWDRALLLEPGEPDHHVEYALCLWQHAAWLSDGDERRAAQRDAIDELHRALRLYDSAKVVARRKAHWWSASCHWMLGEYDEMPAHLWPVLASLEDTDPSGERLAQTALAEHLLSLSYRRSRQWAKAERYAGEAGTHADGAVTAGLALDAHPGAPFGDTALTLGELQALARTQLAGCLADREARHGVAERECTSAEGAVQKLKAKKLRWEIAEAAVLAERGRIALARGTAALKAVSLLERSTGLNPAEADVYVSLACAYEALAGTQAGDERAASRGRARRACTRAKDVAGARHPLWKEADAVDRRLAEADAKDDAVVTVEVTQRPAAPERPPRDREARTVTPAV